MSRQPSAPVILEIDELDPQGFGLGRNGDEQVAVFGALPGERVEARVVKRRRKMLFGRMESLQVRAEDRVEPICRHSDLCAGCSFQHLDSVVQLRFKEEQLAAALRARLGDSGPTRWLDPLEGPLLGYRSKARLGVKYVEKKGRVLIGFREKMSSFIAEIDSCATLVEPLARLLPGLLQLVGRLDARRTIPQIEVAAGDDEAALVVRHLEEVSARDLEALCAFGNEAGVRIYLQGGGRETVRLVEPSGAAEWLCYELPDHDVKMAFHPLDFTQVNLAMNRRMIDQAIGLLNPGRGERILDLYCGIGNLTLPVARLAGEVLGIEGAPSAVERARQNGESNGVDNVAFQCLDLDRGDDLSVISDRDWNKVIIDPPRSGAERVCGAIGHSSVRHVLYISCNPATLARDSALLVANGFRLDCAGVVDMFPHTTHVEAMASFIREG